MAILESVLIGAARGFVGLATGRHREGDFYVVGICLMVKGVYRIVNYFAVHGKYDFYTMTCLYGIIALVFGVLVVLWEQPE